MFSAGTCLGQHIRTNQQTMTTAYFTYEGGEEWRGRSSELLQITKTNNNCDNPRATTTAGKGERGKSAGDVIEFNQNCLVHQTDNYQQYILPISPISSKRDNPTMATRRQQRVTNKRKKEGKESSEQPLGCLPSIS